MPSLGRGLAAQRGRLSSSGTKQLSACLLGFFQTSGYFKPLEMLDGCFKPSGRLMDLSDASFKPLDTTVAHGKRAPSFQLHCSPGGNPTHFRSVKHAFPWLPAKLAPGGECKLMAIKHKQNPPSSLPHSVPCRSPFTLRPPLNVHFQRIYGMSKQFLPPPRSRQKNEFQILARRSSWEDFPKALTLAFSPCFKQILFVDNVYTGSIPPPLEKVVGLPKKRAWHHVYLEGLLYVL